MLVVCLSALLLLAACSRTPATRRPSVVLVIMDTVRRDLVTPCGCEHPTTPNLQKLANRGTTFCRMIAPGSWTVPVHASIFTGEMPHVHGADFIPQGTSLPGFSHLSIAVMREDLPTLAERFRAAGYQTVLASANPLVHPALGLTRGFDVIRVQEGLGLGEQGAVYPKVEDILVKDLDPKRPLFLVANINLAHSPYEQVPPGNDWVQPTGRVLSVYADGFFKRYTTGEPADAKVERYLNALRNAYRWGVKLADEDFGAVMSLLKKHGWLDAGTTVVVASDHGELLGEHGLLDHGRTVVRENTDLFAIVSGPGFGKDTRVEHLVQSQDLYATLLHAAGLWASPAPFVVPLQQPLPGRVAVTVSQPDKHWNTLTGGKLGAHRYVAVQQGELRVVWTDPDKLTGERVEAWAPTIAPADVQPELAGLAGRMGLLARQGYGSGARPPPDLVETMRSLGYVE
jgi:arylsulfatase A-like enzyme